MAIDTDGCTDDVKEVVGCGTDSPRMSLGSCTYLAIGDVASEGVRGPYLGTQGLGVSDFVGANQLGAQQVTVIWQQKFMATTAPYRGPVLGIVRRALSVACATRAGVRWCSEGLRIRLYSVRLGTAPSTGGHCNVTASRAIPVASLAWKVYA